MQSSASISLRLATWQRARTLARLIREAEDLWHVDVKDLRRLGALELDQLLSSNQELLTPLLYWMPLNLPDSFSQALSYPVKILKLNSPKPVIW